MAIYRAPLRDMRFVIHEVLDAGRRFSEMPAHAETSPDLVDAVLEEAARLFENVVFPTNQAGHREGCRMEDGVVHTPAGFKEAYAAVVAGGWTSLSSEPEYGGQGLPEVLAFCIEEMFSSANVALSLYSGLTHGAYCALVAHGSQALKRTFLPRMIDGTWTGTMCLTEPQAGTDLGLLRTKAVPEEDGTYRITGSKIFITGGEHDLTENIVHLVLARCPDAPPGVRGISLFVAPKYLVNEDGSLGPRNAVSCGAIEKKMGLKGSATCVMNFDAATGYLVGEENRGLAAMFTMMNHERLAVGIEGLGLAETAYQSAVEYARERLQGRAPNGPQAPERAADPIIVHPDVRRMLLTTRAFNEGARALAGWIALQIDLSEQHPDPEVRGRAEDLVALLTPVVKAFFTDLGTDSCNRCLQVFGGHGYIAEWGMEQLVRDARIAQIYEGANGVQAMDLVGRKLFAHDGRLVRRLFDAVDGFVAEHRNEPRLGEFLDPVAAAARRLAEATAWLREASRDNRDELGAAAYDYLSLTGLVAIGFMWARMAEVALAKEAGDNSGFYRAKLATGRYFMRRLLPRAAGHYETIVSGAESLMGLEAEAF